MFAKGSFVRGNMKQATANLKAHLKYLRYRSQEGKYENRSFFSKDQTNMNRKEIVQDIMAHATGGMCYHKLVLSPAENEPVLDWQTWTRAVMKDLEQYQEKNLHWYAILHTNTKHPHIHIVLAGLGENHQGKKATVALYTQRQSKNGKDDFELLKKSGQEHSEYDYTRTIETLVKELDTLPDDTTAIDIDRPQEGIHLLP